MTVDMTKLGALVSEQMDAMQESYAGDEEFEVTNCVLIANVAKKDSADTGMLRVRAPRGQNLYLTIGLLDAGKRIMADQLKEPS